MSTTAKAYVLALEKFYVAASEQTLDELVDVMRRDKFNRYGSKLERAQRVSTYQQVVRRVDVNIQVTDCKDPKDNKFLELAICAGAKLIVSGDKKHLLSMSPYRGIDILGVNDFLTRYSD